MTSERELLLREADRLVEAERAKAAAKVACAGSRTIRG